MERCQHTNSGVTKHPKGDVWISQLYNSLKPNTPKVSFVRWIGHVLAGIHDTLECSILITRQRCQYDTCRVYNDHLECHMTPNSVSYDTWRGVIWRPTWCHLRPTRCQHGVIWHPAWCLMTPNWCNVTLSRVSDDTYLVSYGTRHGVTEKIRGVVWHLWRYWQHWISISFRRHLLESHFPHFDISWECSRLLLVTPLWRN